MSTTLPSGDELRGAPPAPVIVPILLYHSVRSRPITGMERYTVSPGTFAAHLDLLLRLGCRPLTVSGLVEAAACRALPEHPVAVTFDDGWHDFAEEAAPALAERGVPATLYLTTGAVGPRRDGELALVPGPMLDWAQLPELQAMGIELGAHGHSHRRLDELSRRQAATEIRRSKAMLEDHLGNRVRSFAYPHGAHSRHTAALVAEAGFESGAAVRNALSSETDDRYRLSRLMITHATSTDEIGAWLAGRGARVAPFRERPRTTAYRWARRARTAVSGPQRWGGSPP